LTFTQYAERPERWASQGVSRQCLRSLVCRRAQKIRFSGRLPLNKAIA
jgi:hypothetical protein